MTNRFGLDLPPDRVRWTAAEGATEDVIAAVLLLSTTTALMKSRPLSAAELD
jgi:hypothetical protein